MTVSSLYDLLYDPAWLGKHRFVEWFMGNDLRSIWTKTNTSGTGTFAMADTEDGGYVITSAGTNGNHSNINHNLKFSFGFMSSRIIAIMKASSSVTVKSMAGFTSVLSPLTTVSQVLAGSITSADATNFVLQTSDAGVATVSSTGVPLDTNFHLWVIHVLGASALAYLDGVLLVTKTTNLPEAPLQPCVWAGTLATATRATTIKYYEAFNI